MGSWCSPHGRSARLGSHRPFPRAVARPHRHKRRLERVGTSLPAKGSYISSAEPAVLAEREGRGVREIAIGGADIVGEDIARPDDRIGGNGGAASKRLDHQERESGV